MARRAAGGRRVFAPGVRDALVEHWRSLDRRWSGRAFAALADAVDAGHPVRVDGEVVWRALFGVSERAAEPFLGDEALYELGASGDVLEVVE